MNRPIVMAMLVIALNACNSRDDASVSVDAPQILYAAQPTHYSWPAAQNSVALASSLLTSNYYLVIDGSGSMSDPGCSNDRPKLDVAREAVVQFIDSIPEDANVGLLSFDERGIGERVALGNDKTAIKQYVQTMQASGGTPLRSSIEMAYDAVTLQGQKQLGYGEYHLVVVTDGEANSGEDPGSIVEHILQESPVTVHTIGFCIGDGHSLNIPGVTDYRAANNPSELLAGLKSVLAESNEYVSDQFESGNPAQ